MLTIEVRLLTGRYAATAYNDRRRAEWPPHPARLFSALVAAHHERPPTIEHDMVAAERAALEWLECQAVPALAVPLDGAGAAHRTVLDTYVPVNDVTLVGDVEAPLRAALERLKALEEDDGSDARAIAQARKGVEKERRKLAATLAQRQVIDPRPTAAALTAASALLPDRRTRQVRTFPVVLVEPPTFAFVWPADAPADVRDALDRLCRRVTRLGHSSSLVSCSVVGTDASPNLVPDQEGNIVLRTVGPGQLKRLEQEYERHQAVERRVLPARATRYGGRRGGGYRQPLAHSVFAASEDGWVVFERVGGARLLSSRGPELATALRAALVEQHGAPTLPGVISGHLRDGRPADRPHVAFVPLPFVGHAHADASIQGCAVVLPLEISREDRILLLRLIATWERDRAVDEEATLELAGRDLPPVRLRRVELSSKVTLRPSTWCRPSTRFVTATPIALDRNPGNLRSNASKAAYKASAEAADSIALACRRIGLPAPMSVEVSLSPLLIGSQAVQCFRRWPAQPGRTPRVRVHADMRFSEPVRGPLLLGAGRFYGLGLCLPVGTENEL
ncbi:MAG: type I-U CRISPR-associated protein Csb2 [Vicinamibacterales bacterium]